MKLTYQELEAKLQRTEEILARALDEIAKLHGEISKLKEQINRNSKNSSKPPSTDQKSNTSENKRKPREPRAGKARIPFSADRVDSHVQCSQENCRHCGSSAIELSGQSGERWQQAELPEVRAIVTEYELLKYHCKECGKSSISSLPDGVPDSAFGPKLMGLLVTLTGVMHVAKREAIQLIKDLYDVDMSLGSVPNIEERVAKALDPIYDRIHKFVIESRFCKYFDETGWRDSGKRHFVWLASCEHAAVYMIDRTRSAAAFKRLTGKESWEAPSVTDRYGVYSSLKTHQYCLAHLIREFRGYSEREGPDKEIGQALEKGLSQACSVHKEYRQGNISLSCRNRRLGQRKRKVQFWLEDGMANGSDLLSKLCETLLDNFEKLWTFAKIPGMEPTNNTAERDLRKLVLWRKKSYGTRSERGKRFVERLTTVAQTLRKQGQNVLRYVQCSIENFYAKRSPSLICEAMGF
jgi:transposase